MTLHVSALLKRHPLLAFFVLAFAISWICWSPLFAAQVDAQVPLKLFIILGGFGPAISAIIVTGVVGGRAALCDWRDRILRWRVGARWYLLVVLLSPALLLSAYGLHVLLGGNLPDLPTNSYVYLMFPVFFLQNLFLGGGQEEPAWRGFALPRLQAKYSAFVSSVILGVLWAFWHFPLFFSPVSSQSGLPFYWYLLHVIAMAIVYTWIFNNTNGSVFIVALFHGFGNTFPGYLPLDNTGGATSPFALLIGLEWLVAIVLLVVYGSARLSRKSTF